MARLRAPGRLPVGPRADLRLHQAVHARRDLRGARRHRPARLERPGRRAGRLPAAGGLLRRRWRAEAGPFHASTTRSMPSTRSWSGAIRTSSASESAETAGDVKRIWGEVKAAEKKEQGQHRRRPAGSGAARPAGAGGGAADRLARRRSGLRLGESRAGAREAARRAGRIRRGAARRRRRPSWKTSWATCCSCWSTWRASSRWIRSRRCAGPTPSSASASATSSASWPSAARRLQESNIEEMEALWQEAKR